MAADRNSGFSSPFDAMLKKDRERLERLYRDPSEEEDRSAATLAPPPRGGPSRTAASPRPLIREEARRARPAPASPREQLSGTADGVPFSFRPDG